MSAQDLKPYLKKCKALVLAGQRGQILADSLGVSKRTTERYIEKLVYMGELKDVTGDKKSTPRVYEDGRARVCYNSFLSLDGEKSQIDPNNPEIYDFSKRGVPSTPNLSLEGLSSGCVRFHCTGCYEVPVIRLGDSAGRITDKDGYTIGGWSDMRVCNGSRRQYGTVRLYPNEDLKFTLFYFREGDQEGQKLTVTPNPRDVYYKTAKRTGPPLLEEQVNRLLDVLTNNHNWLFARPVFKGTYHFGLTDPELAPLLSLSDKHMDRDDARLHVDMSHGDPELEVYGASDGNLDQAQEDVINIQELPELLDNMKSSLIQIHGVLKIVVASVGELTKSQAELIKAQAQTVQTIAETKIKEFDGVGYQ